MAVRLGMACLLMATAARAADGGAAARRAGERLAGQSTVRIIVTDSGFVASDRIPAGLRHIIFENRGKEIHEGMLVACRMACAHRIMSPR